MNEKSVQWPIDIKPPLAEKKSQLFTSHDDTRVDNYYWMNDYFKKGPESSKVIEHLNAENDYLEKMMGPTKLFQQTLFDELKSRVKEKDESVPYKENGFWYYVKFETDSQYPVYCRKQESISSPESIIHDCNAAAVGKSYYHASAPKISDDNKLMVVGEDTMSRRLYTLRFKDLTTGEFFAESIDNTQADDYAWAADNASVFYILKDLNTLLGFQVWRHVIGTDPNTDSKVYEEEDNRHYLSLKRTKSKAYLVIESELSEQQSEHRILDASTPANDFKIFQLRKEGLVYDIDHYQDKFYIRTNLDAPNFRLMQTPDHSTSIDNWKEVISHRMETYLAGITVFKEYLVVAERNRGLMQLRVINQINKQEHYIPFSEEAYSAFTGHNPAFDTKLFRFNYTSMISPFAVYDYNMETHEKELKKEQEIVGGYNKDAYFSERFFVTARDGAEIPVSIVYKKGILKDGSSPLLLYAYGSYGVSNDADFDRNRLSLLNRGFIYAIAHVRGGQEMGREWYENGKMLQKKNTFFDFIDCADYLVSLKYTSAEHLYANGGSAGGLLMGVVVNLRPELWHGVVADVPYVDVITTMSDPDIPLTTAEYLEWGNPAIDTEYFYMKSYSPLDNVKEQEYPNMLVTTGLHDSQVQYFEPAKWVSKIREMKTDSNIILLHTNMVAGHGGASGRFEYLKEIALLYAFLLFLERITN